MTESASPEGHDWSGCRGLRTPLRSADPLWSTPIHRTAERTFLPV